MLIINDYELHITTNTITYYIQRKINLLYLLFHITYLLQLLNINVFTSLITIYKARV